MSKKQESSHEDDPWLTPNEMAKRVRVHSSTIRNFIRDGILPAFRIGRQWRVKESDFNAWLEKKQQKP